MSSQRMTNELMAKIVASALKATNLDAERDAIISDTKKRVHDVLIQQLPVDLLKLVQKHPREWFQWQDQVYAGNVDNDPIAIVGRGYMATESRLSSSYLSVEPSIPTVGHRSAKLDAAKDLADLIKRADAWINKRDAAQMELRQFLRSCSTVAKAIERMPEIEKHIPPAAVRTAYPIVAASGALSALTALGFDTTTKA